MISEIQKTQIEKFVTENKEETLILLKEITAIPAPTFHEEKKAELVLRWLKAEGTDEAYMDEEGNVIYEYGKQEEVVIFMAHLDVVFPDTEPFQIIEEGKKWSAPGILDDNANLVNMLMCVKFLLVHRPCIPVGLVFVANTCEEGLGNLRGSKAIYRKYGERIREFVGFDANRNHIVEKAVGSQRYRVIVKTEGGHSYTAFGNANAIYELSRIIQSLYQVQLPDKARTTYNVGMIEGGTSVNTIAGEASMLYEFRSEDEACLTYMEYYFSDVIERYKKEGLDVRTEILGVRPCAKGVDAVRQQELTERHQQIIHIFSDEKIERRTGSTDANTFLSHGIPSNVIGTASGGRTHTRDEWIWADSLEVGQKIAIGSVLAAIRE